MIRELLYFATYDIARFPENRHYNDQRTPMAKRIIIIIHQARRWYRLLDTKDAFLRITSKNGPKTRSWNPEILKDGALATILGGRGHQIPPMNRNSALRNTMGCFMGRSKDSWPSLLHEGGFCRRGIKEVLFLSVFFFYADIHPILRIR